MRYHTAIYCVMSITCNRFRPPWVSSGGWCKKTLNNKHAEKTNLPLGAQKCNTKQYDTRNAYNTRNTCNAIQNNMNHSSYKDCFKNQIRFSCTELLFFGAGSFISALE